MSLFKKIIYGVLAIVVLLIIGGFFFYNKLTPTYSGEIQLKNLNEISTTYYDEFGIPHIYSESKEDAFTTLGYVHAQDRLWQMELLRRIAPGKLSEIFGSVMVKNDVFFKTLGINEYTEQTVNNLDKNTEAYKLANAYVNGINEFMEQGPTPIEFILLGIEKEPFKINDVYNILGYMSFSFAMAHKTDPLLSLLQEKLGDEYLQYLNISVNPNSTLKRNFKGNTKQLEAIVANVNQVLSNT
ncbi:MAG TPA: penicillin acylase family protein, partial [Flavobacteriaceae bacterium]|nr:penicillin acylase family protein [Flavobacteriaceae bacterium]